MRTQNKTNAGKRVRPIRDWFLIFTSDWLGEWREFSKPITKQSKTKPKQPPARFTFDTRLKIDLVEVSNAVIKRLLMGGLRVGSKSWFSFKKNNWTRLWAFSIEPFVFQ